MTAALSSCTHRKPFADLKGLQFLQCWNAQACQTTVAQLMNRNLESAFKAEICIGAAKFVLVQLPSECAQQQDHVKITRTLNTSSDRALLCCAIAHILQQNSSSAIVTCGCSCKGTCSKTSYLGVVAVIGRLVTRALLHHVRSSGSRSSVWMPDAGPSCTIWIGPLGNWRARRATCRT